MLFARLRSAIFPEIVTLLSIVCPLVLIAARPVMTIVPTFPTVNVKPVNVSVFPERFPSTELVRYTNPAGNVSMIIPVVELLHKFPYESVYTIISPE